MSFAVSTSKSFGSRSDAAALSWILDSSHLPLRHIESRMSRVREAAKSSIGKSSSLLVAGKAFASDSEHETSLRHVNFDGGTIDSFFADSNFRRVSTAFSLLLIAPSWLSVCRGCSRKQRPFVATATAGKMEWSSFLRFLFGDPADGWTERWNFFVASDTPAICLSAIPTFLRLFYSPPTCENAFIQAQKASWISFFSTK